MVAAITALGLSDSIDVVYGSSAGAVVGAYLVSGQVCLDVYCDILPAARERFVCKRRLVAHLASLGLRQMLGGGGGGGGEERRGARALRERLSHAVPPGMNASFVLDGVMGDRGLRPLDVDAFRANGARQRLRVVSSCVEPGTGRLRARCFGDEEFFHGDRALARADREREGLFACLEASMTVPVSIALVQ